MRPTVADIDLVALAANYQAIEAFLAQSTQLGSRSRPPSIIAVVKANAYGHGAAPVALALERAGARAFACADIEEGVQLRTAGVGGKILVFGALGISDLEGVFAYGLTPTISTPSACRALEAAARKHGTRLACQLKIDTGMNRLGFRFDNLARTMVEVRESARLEIEAVYTHFATADDTDCELFGEQRERFNRALGELASLGIAPTVRHAANSAALIRDERVWFEAVRPGLLLYGLVPPPLATTLPLVPVMSLVSRIVAVKGQRGGESVGYGARHRTDVPARTAVVPAGYADGLDLRLGGRGFVLVRGVRAPIIGAVSMDMITIDATGIDVEPGDEVVLVGAQGGERIDVREIAAAIGTIPYELLCRIGSRIERRYRG